MKLVLYLCISVCRYLAVSEWQFLFLKGRKKSLMVKVLCSCNTVIVKCPVDRLSLLLGEGFDYVLKMLAHSGLVILLSGLLRVSLTHGERGSGYCFVQGRETSPIFT